MGAKGTKNHKPTDQTRRFVESMSAYGIPQPQIALCMSVSVDTLLRHYRHEIEVGAPRANAKVAESLFQQAIKGNVRAQTFWLKCRARWKPVERREITGADGAPIQVEDARAELRELVGRFRDARVVEAGAVEEVDAGAEARGNGANGAQEQAQRAIEGKRKRGRSNGRNGSGSK